MSGSVWGVIRGFGNSVGPLRSPVGLRPDLAFDRIAGWIAQKIRRYLPLLIFIGHDRPECKSIR